MTCKKQLVLTGYRVQYVDLREPKPRIPKEEIYVMDSQWLDALSLLHIVPSATIKSQYERAGYRVFAVEPIKPKRVADLDLCQLYGISAQEVSRK